MLHWTICNFSAEQAHFAEVVMLEWTAVRLLKEKSSLHFSPESRGPRVPFMCRVELCDVRWFWPLTNTNLLVCDFTMKYTTLLHGHCSSAPLVLNVPLHKCCSTKRPAFLVMWWFWEFEFPPYQNISPQKSRLCQELLVRHHIQGGCPKLARCRFWWI